MLPIWGGRGKGRTPTFEGLVIEELAAWATRTIIKPELFFWRTLAGAEVDLLMADGGRIIPIEIKLGAAVDGRSLRGLGQFEKERWIPLEEQRSGLRGFPRAKQP